MRFDVRLLIGLMFLIFGVIVTITGVVGASPRLEIDIVWGLVMVGFGAIMVGLAIVSARRSRP